MLLGGQLKASVKKMNAVTKGATYTYANQSKIKVLKNQLPSPYTITYEGDIVCTPHGMIPADKDSIEEYRSQYIGDILKRLNEISEENNSGQVIKESDISFEETEEIES